MQVPWWVGVIAITPAWLMQIALDWGFGDWEYWALGGAVIWAYIIGLRANPKRPR